MNSFFFLERFWFFNGFLWVQMYDIGMITHVILKLVIQNELGSLYIKSKNRTLFSSFRSLKSLLMFPECQCEALYGGREGQAQLSSSPQLLGSRKMRQSSLYFSHRLGLPFRDPWNMLWCVAFFADQCSHIMIYLYFLQYQFLRCFRLIQISQAAYWKLRQANLNQHTQIFSDMGIVQENAIK